MSRRLTERSIDHVVLERGEVANSWRTERWDSLRLLTPNWHTRLPGRTSRDDPDGFMAMPEVVALIDGYARTIDAPVHTGTTVTRVAVGRRRVHGRHRPRHVAVRERRAGDGACERRRPSRRSPPPFPGGSPASPR